jgi:dienelactone hydrolase
MTMKHRFDAPRRVPMLLLALLMIGGSLAWPAAVDAQTANPYERGPAPTRASIEAARGPYAVATTAVSSAAVGPGFGGGTIYYPTTTADGTFGAVAISPGYTGTQSSVSWYGARLASQGFVVITIDTNSRFDQPDSRGAQLLAALDYLTGASPVRTRIDAGRLAVMGHSMGGGGALRASASRPSLKASIPLTAWHGTKNWSAARVPQLIIGAQNDSVASVGAHSIPFYESLPATSPKAYLKLAGAGHGAPNSANTTIASYSISWLKRFVDDDTRYDQFLCGPNHTASAAIRDYRSTCPYTSAPPPSTTTTAPPTTTTAPPPTTTTTAPPVATCVTASTVSHVSADRASYLWGYTYAVGTRDALGRYSSANVVSLRQGGPGSWSRVAAC